MPSIVGILLAAGEGSRFGGDKLLAPMPADSGAESSGVPLGAVAGSRLVDALPDAIAVVRPRDARLSACLSAVGLRVVRCANADEGMGASLACGVSAARDADGWVIALADMPWIASATIRAIAAALARGADIAAPSYRGERGHPVGFARRHYDTLAALTGDTGARSLIERSLSRITWIDVDDAGVLRDVDTRSQLGASG
jgi:molybdenum cofactor cytidylyltransferase